jgi:hypothetical protein
LTGELRGPKIRTPRWLHSGPGKLPANRRAGSLTDSRRGGAPRNTRCRPPVVLRASPRQGLTAWREGE